MKQRRFVAALTIAIVLSVVAFARLEAQRATNGLTVHPSNFDLLLTPGAKTEHTITVDNLTDTDYVVHADRKNFTAEGEEGGVKFDGENGTFALASWIRVTPEKITIPAHRSQTFTYTITPPLNAEPGGHFGSILFVTDPVKPANGTGAAVSEEVASLILARIPGDVKEQAIVESFNTDKSFYEFGPVTFDLRVKNTGGVHILPQGSIQITDMLGRKTDVLLDGRNVLPNTIRHMPQMWKTHFLIGRYTARLIAAYGSKNEQLSASVIFYAFPIRYGALAIIILIIIFILRRRLGKALKALFTGK